MRITIALPDATLRQARVLASSRGTTLEQLFTEALEDRLHREAPALRGARGEASWMAGLGALSDLAEENRRMAGVNEDEFENAGA